MSFSAPSAINMEHSIVKFDKEVEKCNIARRQSEQSGAGDNASQEAIPIRTESTTHDWQSLSCLTDSTEHSAPINFDMSNRAKLPRGIDKIRPHIELIDNVPLLVSLFTDCTPLATREMLKIMQDYKEVVCLIGSSESCENAGIFMQADASISVEPLYPQVCQKIEAFKKPDCLGPLELSSKLNSIACSLSTKREDPISIYHLIMEARHFVTTLWCSVQYWLCCCMILSLTQVVATMLMLPGLLTTGHLLWFICIVIPVLSVSLMMRPVDPEVMKKPQGKSQPYFTLDTALFILWCYGTKFLPTLVTVLVSYTSVLASHCEQLRRINGTYSCVFFYNPVIVKDSITIGGWEEDSWTIMTARLMVIFIILLHLVTISVGFVHRDYLVLKKSPHSNLMWLITVFLLISVQSLYSILTYKRILEETEKHLQFNIPLWIILFSALSPLGIFSINEVIKRQEIKVNKRFLKRARLDFGTKLGMNSPF